LVTFFRNPNRNFRDKLIVSLSIADIIWVSNILTGLLWSLTNDSDLSGMPHSLCIITGWLTQWFAFSEDCWVSAIAVYMYISIVKSRETKRQALLYHIGCWGIPGAVSILPFFRLGGYGLAGTWCWLKDPAARLYLGYSFPWLTTIIVVVSYYLTIRYILKSTREVRKTINTSNSPALMEKNRRLFRKLAAYPLIFILQWTPATINRIQNELYPNDPIVILYVIHIFTVTSSGWLNGIFYASYINCGDCLKCLRREERTPLVTRINVQGYF